MWASEVKSLNRNSLCKKPDNLDDVLYLLPTKPYICLICQKHVAANEWHNHHPNKKVRRIGKNGPSYNDVRACCSACGMLLYDDLIDS